jgi:2,3-bisphosphoglycerate-independent phosphoglycerate mutase
MLVTDKFQQLLLCSMDVADHKIIYILLDGIGDLPHPLLNNLTPLDAAHTPHLDILAQQGCMGEAISVGRGISPQSDIAVFNMLGYDFKNGGYVGRGVIESIGSGIDFRDGDLALRGNFASVDSNLRLIDRRAGRAILKEESQAICKTLREKIILSDKNASFIIEPTIAHRVALRFRHQSIKLSENITNTDPAYGKVNGIGVANPQNGEMYLEKSKPLESTEGSRYAANLVNEFTDQSLKLLRDHPINRARAEAGNTPINAILVRDAGNKYPTVKPIKEKYDVDVACIVDMPVEVGISKVLGMESYEAGDINDYQKKALTAARIIEKFGIVYVHIKGPDEFGHDGQAKGKTSNIEQIDNLFFGNLRKYLTADNVTFVISGDHSTPCIKRAHSDDPIPLLISGKFVRKDASRRFTEYYASKGRLGLVMGSDVLSTAIRYSRQNNAM